MIEKMTKAQEKKVPVYLKKWLYLGRRTKTISKPKAKKAINFYYKLMGMEKPKYIIFLDSPMAVNIACNLIKDTKFDAKPDSQLRSQLRSQLDSQLDSQLRSQLRSQLDSQLDSQLRSQLDSQLYSQLDSQLRSQLDSQLRSQLDSQLRSQLRSQKLQHFGSTWNNMYWTNVYGFYDFALQELFPKKKKEFKLFQEFLGHHQEIHYFTAFKEIVFISDFPKEIHTNNRGQLHSTSGAALLYRDTYSMFRLNGINVDEATAIIKPEEITKNHILKQTNADIRREIIRKLSSEQLLSVLDSKVIDENHGYQLITVDVGDNRVRPFLKMNNPSLKGVIHVEGVRPEITTVEAAIMYRNGLETFKMPKELS